MQGDVVNLNNQRSWTLYNRKMKEDLSVDKDMAALTDILNVARAVIRSPESKTEKAGKLLKQLYIMYEPYKNIPFTDKKTNETRSKIQKLLDLLEERVRLKKNN